MGRTGFDSLHTLCLERESKNGCVELCQEPDGTRWTKLRLASPACQREFLAVLDPAIPVRLKNGVLELLLPWQGGLSLRQWLYEQTPTLGQRRDACLSLLEQQLEIRGRLPPCLTALSAAPENLTVDSRGMFLQFIPDLQSWEPGITEAQAVRALARVIYTALIFQADWTRRGQLPAEVQLLWLRQKEESYTGWGQLQRDLTAVPDEPRRAGSTLRTQTRRMRSRLYRFAPFILRLLAILLLAAALLSLGLTFRQRSSGDLNIWPGMFQVGGQDLRSKEDSG